jgi:uncharacterized repeat protein (TIGR01451 family)
VLQPALPSRQRSPRLLVSLALVAAALTFTTSIAPSSPAAAVEITVGPIEAQMANHRGTTEDTRPVGGGNCIRYSGRASGSADPSSTFVTNTGTQTNEARSAHGLTGGCPSTLNINEQSAMGFRPTAALTVDDGVQFLIGRMIHYNNPIQAADRYFVGELNVRLSGIDEDPTLEFPWTLDETPNVGGTPNDEIAFSSQISPVTFSQDGFTYRLVIFGFRPVAAGTTCPATPSGNPVNRFSTVEGAQTHACLYASLQQDRSPLTVVKQVVGSPPQPKTFAFTSSSSLAGSPWENGSFTLVAGGQEARDLTSGNTITVTETDPNDDRWGLTSLACTQIGANGQPQPVPSATVNLAARQVVLANIPAPPNPDQSGITCTFTNTYTPTATLTLVKEVTSGTAPPSAWTLTATGPDEISGPSGSSEVTARRVRAGTYLLTETGTGPAETGYVRQGNWVCETGAGANVPVTPGGSVTLTDSAASDASAGVTCTVTNRLATGSLQINKSVDDPQGGYTGGTTKTFAGTYDCGPGAGGSFSTLTTVTPVTITDIPAGRTCSVTETPPTGGLLNASYAWGPATTSAQPVTITDQGTAAVTITNHVIQRFGTFAVTKVVDGPGGYTGGTSRVFPVGYTCTLTGGPTTSGTVDATLGGPVSPAESIPVGSVCSFTETLTEQPGDFIDPSYTWSGSAFSPATVTIGADTTASVTLTNAYIEEFGSLVIAKQVVGDGYLGGTGEHFTVLYSCGTDFQGAVTVADGGMTTIDDLPAGVTCDVQEVGPDESLLAPAFDWGTPTWDPATSATIPANGSTTLTVSNPTVPVFGQVRVTKEIAGETQGVVAGASFDLVASCGTAGDFAFQLGVGETGTTPNIPVGTSCTISETAPSGGLIDSSYAWGETPDPQTVTITETGQVVAVAMTNTVVRVTGTLSITKAPIAPGDVVDPARTFSIDFSCAYGGDAPVTGTVSLAQGETASTPPVFLGSRCTVTEDPLELQDPPDPTDDSWVWLPVTYVPDPPVVVVDSATTPVTVTVVNSIRQLTGSFSVTKAVVGEGKEGGYDGSPFGFTLSCGGTPSFELADGESFDSGEVVAGTSCTLTEVSVPPPTGPEYGWDPVTFTINGTPAGTGNSVTFVVPEVPPEGTPLQINVTNPITPRFGSVTVTKTVTGLTDGLAPDAPPFVVQLNCGVGRIFELSVPANDSATGDDIPAGSVCTPIESEPTGGLVDASYAWGDTTYDPETVTVVVDATVEVGVTNPIVRVTAPLQLVKTYTGPQGVVDPIPTDRTYPVTWSCTYNGTEIDGGTVDIVAGPDGITVADAIPITSECTATEGDLGPPSADPAFRWLEPVITGTTVSLAGPNTVTVANELVRDNGRVIVQKTVTGATEGYVGGTDESFTLHGQCSVPGTGIPVRTRSGTIADGGEVIVTPVSIGWTCFGVEETPSQDLLADASYAWGEPILDPPGDFVLTLAEPEIVFSVENPIERVTGTFSVAKVVDDPFDAVADGTTFSGTWTCEHPGDPAATGVWEITFPATTFEVSEEILLESACTVTENSPPAFEDGSLSWSEPVIVGATVVPGGTATVTVTNTVERVFGGLEISKTVVDPDGGVLPGARFPGVWECIDQSGVTHAGRYTVGGDDTTTAFTAADGDVPALAECTITEDTPFEQAGLRAGSFAWGAETYEPESVELQAGQMAELGVTNRVVRVYSDVLVSKRVTGPAADLVPIGREFTGRISCRYGGGRPVGTTWGTSVGGAALRAGVLVGSVCTVAEDSPGFGGGPVAGDSSYVWLDSITSDPVTVAPPTEPGRRIVATNPTARLFGTFDVTKRVSGATEGIVDRTEPYRMEFECMSQSDEQISGELQVPSRRTRRVGPGQRIPTGSVCTITEPLDGLPDLVDDTYRWGQPTFSIDGRPVDPVGRQLDFRIPAPQEDEQEPNVEIVVDNVVIHGSQPELAITKEVSSPPTRNADGTVSLTYDVAVSNAGNGPVDYDLTDEFLFADGVVVTEVSVANVEPGGIPVNPDFDGSTDLAIASASLAGRATHRYRITVTADASAVTADTLLDCVRDPGEEGTGFLNRATVNPSAEACAPIPGPADLSVVKNVDRTDVTIDPSDDEYTRLTYTIEVANNGPAIAEDVVALDILPGGVVPVSATPSAGTCARAGALLACLLGDMAVGATEEIIVVIDLLPTEPEGTVVNSVAVGSATPDPDPRNNDDAAETTVNHPGGPLPITGAQLAGIIGLALILAGAGWFFFTAARARRIEVS